MSKRSEQELADYQIEHAIRSLQHHLLDRGGIACYYLANVVCGIATIPIQRALVPQVGPWPETTSAKRRALRDGIDAAIEALKATKTHFDL